ncbi:hypothetical protein O3G_MSEX011965 [Manduca sexta]|uniref:Uncharacterized protein n=1 Tax=Manduca sexta TaxID=7130 RepID=A0A921ZMK7_MANSE|nr:hypothetical protein O3G_MSEX011965 [Manduca sexta]
MFVPDCVLDFRKDFDTKNPVPIIITGNKLLKPDPNSCSARLSKGSKIRIGCPGFLNSIMDENGRIDTGTSVLEAYCDGGNQFKSDDSVLLETFDMKDISCRERHEIKFKLPSKCGKNNIHYNSQ